jgi:hypothetical protein
MRPFLSVFKSTLVFYFRNYSGVLLKAYLNTNLVTEKWTGDFPDTNSYTVEVLLLVSRPWIDSGYRVPINSSPISTKSHIPIWTNENEWLSP